MVSVPLGGLLVGSEMLQIAMNVPIAVAHLMMAPYGFTILAFVLVSRGKTRRQRATPAALGTPYIRGQ